MRRRLGERLTDWEPGDLRPGPAPGGVTIIAVHRDPETGEVAEIIYEDAGGRKIVRTTAF